MRYGFACDACGRSFLMERPAFQPPTDPACECGAVARRVYSHHFVIKGGTATSLNPAKKVMVKDGQTASEQERVDAAIVENGRKKAAEEARERKTRRHKNAEWRRRAEVPVHAFAAIKNQEGDDAFSEDRVRDTLKKHNLWYDD